MSIDRKEEKLEQPTKTATPLQESRPSPLGPGSQLVTFGERVTYTFSQGKEIGSIHFDRMRGEIFYKGHTIRYLELSEIQMQMLEKMRTVLATNLQTKRFSEPYGRVLDKVILEKMRAHRSSP